nr:BsuBI/PstI family type II restriction endonuclease [Treponema parvum]
MPVPYPLLYFEFIFLPSFIFGFLGLHFYDNGSSKKLDSEPLILETEVWIADMRDHMIHLNGDKFLEPRK